jgi:DNA-binding response OmpR family regulator
MNSVKETILLIEDSKSTRFLYREFFGKHGFSVLKRIRLNKTTKEIPVLVLTNVKEAENIQKTMSLGANYYAHKESFTPEKTLDVIRELLKKRNE